MTAMAKVVRPDSPKRTQTANAKINRFTVRCQSPLCEFVAPDVPGATADDAKREILRWIERALTATET